MHTGASRFWASKRTCESEDLSPAPPRVFAGNLGCPPLRVLLPTTVTLTFCLLLLWTSLFTPVAIPPQKKGKKAQVISPTECGALFSARTTPQPSQNLVEPWWNPGGTLVEPSWNPRGTLPQGRTVPPWSLSGLRPQSFQLLGKNCLPLVRKGSRASAPAPSPGQTWPPAGATSAQADPTSRSAVRRFLAMAQAKGRTYLRRVHTHWFPWVHTPSGERGMNISRPFGYAKGEFSSSPEPELLVCL